MSTFSISFTPGKTFSNDELLTAAKLNQILGNASFLLEGTVSAASIADGSITTAKLADGVLAASAAGRLKMADGFLSADATGLAKLADAYFAASAAARAKFADGFLTAIKLEEANRQSVHQYFAGTLGAGEYAVPLSPAATAYTAGMVVRFKASAVNAGAVDVNVNALGAKNIFKGVTTELGAGEIKASQMVELVYDGTNFILQSPLGYLPSEQVVGTSRNLVCASASTSTVAAAFDELVLKDAGGRTVLVGSGAGVNYNIGLGVAVNGLDAGAEAASTWYYLWVIYDGTTVSGLMSTSATAPTLPTGYTYKALVGMVRNDAGSNFVSFIQQDRRVWITETVIFTALAGVTSFTATSGAAATALGTAVPPIAKLAQGHMGALTTNKGMEVAGTSAGLGDCGVMGSAQAVTQNSFQHAGWYLVPMATAQTLYYRMMDTTAGEYRLTVTGFTF